MVYTGCLLGIRDGRLVNSLAMTPVLTKHRSNHRLHHGCDHSWDHAAY